MGTSPEGERVILPLGIYPVAPDFTLSSPFYAPQKMMASGLKPSVLMKVSGKVTTEPAIPENESVYVYHVDDGSALPTEDPAVKGIKVIDPYFGYTPPWHKPKPPIASGDQISLTGSLSYETCSDGKIRPIFYCTTNGYNDVPQRGSHQYTISGTVTADANASGQTVWIGCESGGTTAVFDDTGVASYQLKLPAGKHNVFARALGYGGSQNPGEGLWVIDADSDYTDVNFQLYPMGSYNPSTGQFVEEKMIIDIATDKQIAPHDSTSIIEGYVLLRDFEGKRYADKPVTISVTMGQLLSAEPKTDELGKARFRIRSGRSQGCSMITAKSGDLAASSPVYFHNEGEPFVYIANPVNYFPEDIPTFSGEMRVDVVCGHPDVDLCSDLVKKVLLIDGKRCGSFYNTEVEKGEDGVTTETYPSIDTTRFTNGLHTLTAEAVDREGNIGTSNEVNVIFDNVVSEVNISQSEIFVDDPDPGSYSVSAKIREGCNWTLTINDAQNDTVVKSVGGTGPGLATIEWDGKSGGSYAEGIYYSKLHLEQPGSGSEGSSPATAATGIILPPDIAFKCFGISFRHGRALIAGVIRNEGTLLAFAAKQEMVNVWLACRYRGIPCTVVVDPIWTSDVDFEAGNKYRKGMDWYLTQPYQYFYLTTHGSVIQDAVDNQYRTYIDFADGQTIPGNNYFVEERFKKTTPAFSDCNIPRDRYQIVNINACYSCGSFNNPDYSVAAAFGLSDLDNLNGGVYIGWMLEYRPLTFPVLWGLTPNGMGWTAGFWQRMATGYSAQEAIDELNMFPMPWEQGWQKYFLAPTGLSAWVTWLW
jgi:hypothetical protein